MEGTTVTVRGVILKDPVILGGHHMTRKHLSFERTSDSSRFKDYRPRGQCFFSHPAATFRLRVYAFAT